MGKDLLKITFAGLLLFVLTGKAQACIESDTLKTSKSKEKDVDTTKTSFFVDGVRVSASKVIQGMQKGELKTTGGTVDPRQAIQWYGEKYRDGILIFTAIKREEDEQ